MGHQEIKKVARTILQQFFFLSEVNPRETYPIQATNPKGQESGLNLFMGQDGDIYIKTQGDFFLSYEVLGENKKWYRSGCALALLIEAIELDVVKEKKFTLKESSTEKTYDDLRKILSTPIHDLKSLSGLDFGVVHDDCDGDISQTLTMNFVSEGVWVSTNHMYALRFRMPAIGGGRYHRVYNALRILCLSIYYDRLKFERAELKEKERKQKTTP